jgi:hypothetical protein
MFSLMKVLYLNPEGESAEDLSGDGLVRLSRGSGLTGAVDRLVRWSRGYGQAGYVGAGYPDGYVRSKDLCCIIATTSK